MEKRLRDKALDMIDRGVPVAECARLLGIPAKTLYNAKAKAEGARSQRFYSETEKNILLSNYRELGNGELSRMLRKAGYDRTPKAISKWLSNNGYRRPASLIRSLCKNKKSNLFMTKETNPSHNRIKEGERLIRSYGRAKKRWMIKVDGRLKPLHRVIWEEQHGPVPAGYRLKFKNNDQLDCRLENLAIERGSRMEEGTELVRSARGGSQYIAIKVNGKWLRKHRVVWEREYGEIPKGASILCKNGDYLDCRLENLEISTASNYNLSKAKKGADAESPAQRRANAIFSARKKANSGGKKGKSARKNAADRKRQQMTDMTPQERDRANWKQVKGLIRVTDRENKLTRWVTKEQYERKYKGREGFEL